MPNLTAKEATTDEKPTTQVAAAGIDRAAIARVVATVLAAQGITRGSGLPQAKPAPPMSAAPSKEPTSPSSIAAEIAGRLFGSSAKSTDGNGPLTGSAKSNGNSAATAAVTPVAAEKKSEAPPAANAEIQMFVSENDVRRAMTRSEKIFIGRKTILTPSARDLGLEHEVFVETETGSIR